MQISLIDIANSIQTRAASIQEKVLTTKEPLILTADQLVAKVPQFKALGDLPLIRCTAYKTDTHTDFRANSIAIHLNDDGEPTLFDAYLNPVDCEILSFKINRAIGVGSAIVKIKNLELVVSLHLNAEMIADLDTEDIIEGTSEIPSEFLEKYPQVLCSLSSFEIGEKIEILAYVGKSREHDTPLFDVMYQGSKVRNVIANSAMSRGFEKYGIGAKFEICKIRKTKAGKKIDLHFEKDIDFADLAV